jgi:hypothetical protein
MDLDKNIHKADLRFDSIEDLGAEFFLEGIIQPAPKGKKADKDNNPDPGSIITSENNETPPENVPVPETGNPQEESPARNFYDNPETQNGQPEGSEKYSDQDFIKKLDNPALEELLSLGGNYGQPAPPPKAPVEKPVKKPVAKKTPDKKVDSIEKLSTGELSFLSRQVENKKSSEKKTEAAKEPEDQEGIAEQELIETLSSNEISKLVEKFGSLNNIDLLNLELDENKMSLVETFDGLKIASILPSSPPPPPELTDYKPNFVLSDTTEVKKNVPEIKNGKTFARKFDLYETGSFLGITVGQSTKVDVIKVMRDFGSEIFKPSETSKNKSYFAKDLSLSVSFDDEGIVNEMTLGSEFKGQTSKGLRVGDHIKKVFEIYGKAESVTPINFVWDGFVVFHKHDHVTHIRVQKRKGN